MATAGTSTLSDSTKETLRVLRQGAGNRKAIEARLFQLRVTELKQVCKEFNIKISGGSKATLCGRIVSYWQTGDNFMPQTDLLHPSFMGCHS